MTETGRLTDVKTAPGATRRAVQSATRRSGRRTGQAASRPKRRWWWRALVVVAALLVIGGGGPALVAGISSAPRMQTVDTVEPADVAIVYGAGLSGNGPSAYLAARLQVALELYQAGKVKVILVSGDNREVYHNEPAAMTTWLVDRGVPADKIVADFAGLDTYSTCYRAKAIFGVSQAILVSQTYHLPRAIATCRLLGLDAVGVGDTTMRHLLPGRWWEYWLREIPATLNMVWQVVTHRQPVLGPTEDGVQQALGH